MKVKSKSYLQIFLLFLLFIGLGIFYPLVHAILFIPQVLLKPLIAFIFIILSVYTISKKKIEIPNKQFNLIIFIQIIYFSVYSFLYNSQYVSYFVFYAFASWLILLITINTVGLDFFMRFFIKFNVIADVLLVIGVILVALNLIGVYSVIEYQGKNMNNYIFFFMKQINGIDDFNRVRPAGYYDEPGSLAYVTMFLLLINHKYYKNNFVEWILLVLPILTTSLAHIVTVIVYLLFFKFSFKNFHKLLLPLIFVVLIIYGASKIETQNSTINTFLQTTIGRIDNIIESNPDPSRADGFSLGPKIFEKYKFGISPETIEENYPTFTDETFWFPILAFGVFGVFLYFLPIVYVVINPLFGGRIKENEIKYVVLLLLNFGQRPHYIFPLYIILIYFLFFYKPSVKQSVNLCS